MKTIKLLIPIIAIIFFSKSSIAQNNLQFNRAMIYIFTCNGVDWTDDTTITVPYNKVWEIESSSNCGGRNYLFKR